MTNLEKEKTEIPCPGGGRPIQTTFGELTKRSSIKSAKGHEYRFKSNDQNKLEKSMNNIEKLQTEFEKNMLKAKKEFETSFQNLLKNADILLKK